MFDLALNLLLRMHLCNIHLCMHYTLPIRSVYYMFTICLINFLLLSCLSSKLQHYSTNYNFTKKKAIRIINLKPRRFHTNLLFNHNFVLKFQDKTFLENVLFVSKSLKNLSPLVFNTWFRFSSDQHTMKL